MEPRGWKRVRKLCGFWANEYHCVVPKICYELLLSLYDMGILNGVHGGCFQMMFSGCPHFYINSRAGFCKVVFSLALNLAVDINDNHIRLNSIHIYCEGPTVFWRHWVSLNRRCGNISALHDLETCHIKRVTKSEARRTPDAECVLRCKYCHCHNYHLKPCGELHNANVNCPILFVQKRTFAQRLCS